MSINRNKVLKAAQKQIRKRNWDKALREYLKLVEDDATDMRSLLKCGDLYVKLDQIPDALESYKAVADHYAQTDMYEKAIAVYKQAHRLAPEEVALHHAIGECYYRLGRLKDAVRSFHQAQRMYKERGDHDNQRQMLEHMVRIDPEDVGLRVQLAERYTKDGLKEAAVETFSFCAERLEEEGRHDELLQVLERSLYLTPQRYDLRKKAVRLYLDRQDNKSALKHLQICFRELADDIEVMELLAQTFERLDRNEKAVLVLQELAPLYEAAQRTSDATNLYRRILRLDPDHSAAQKALGTSGPDSDVLAGGRIDTDAISKRHNTPAPAANLSEVEFLDDEIEFLDDDLVTEGAPAARSSNSAAMPPASPEASRALQGHVELNDDFDDEYTDLTEDIEFLDENTAAEESKEQYPEAAEIMEIDEFEAIDEFEEVDDSGTSEAKIRTMLSECDVFLNYGLYDNAIDAINRALDLSPDSIYAHQQLLALHQTTGDAEQEYSALIKLAELTKDIPLRVYDYLTQALKVAPNPQAIHSRAEQMGVDLNSPPPTEGIAEISLAAIDPVSDDDESGNVQGPQTLGQDQLVLLDDEDDAGDSDDAGISFLLDEEEESTPEQAPFHDMDDVFEGIDAHVGDSLDAMVGETLTETTDIESAATQEQYQDQEVQELDSLDLVEMELDSQDIELDELQDIELDFDDANMASDTDSEIVSDDEIDFDGVDIVEMDFGGDDQMGDVDLGDLDDLDPQKEQSGPAMNSLFAGVEADELFDDLFGDMSQSHNINLGCDDPIGEMAEIDFFIQQGLTEEAEEAIQSFDSESPNHPGLDKRRNQLHQIRSGLTAEDNPFGARSLSQKFNPTSLESESNPELANFDSVVNSNLELGVAYRDMGLIEEAIEEFQQATDDPEATISAHFNIALCKIDLGEDRDATERLTALLEMDGLSLDVERTVRDKLAELNSQAS